MAGVGLRLLIDEAFAKEVKEQFDEAQKH